LNNFKAVSLSFQNTPLDIRELFAFDEAACKKLLLDLREKFDLNEALVVSTCNRTEVFYSSSQDINDAIINFLVENTQLGEQGDLRKYFRKITDSLEVTKYLFEVSVGLHSQVVGDLQISGQAKDAYQWSADVNMAGTFLHRLMHSIFFTNKRIVQETSYRDGAASISYAATELTDDALGGNKNAQILLVGTGEMGEDVAKNLVSFGYRNISICNRTTENAQILASKLESVQAQIIPFEQLFEKIVNFDVIISAIQVQKPVLTKEQLSHLQILTHKYFIDLSVPRSISQNVEEIPGVILYNIEDLNKKTSEALQKRLDSIPKVNEIIAQSVEEFGNWSKEMEVSPTIHKIKNALETIRLEELNRYNKQLSEDELKLVDTITKSIIQKVIKLPVVQLKAACKRGDTENLVEVLNELFDLEKQRVSA
jgi:glutamyl-tRNA reductase